MDSPVEFEHEEKGEIHHLPLIESGYIVSSSFSTLQLLSRDIAFLSY